MAAGVSANSGASREMMTNGDRGGARPRSGYPGARKGKGSG